MFLINLLIGAGLVYVGIMLLIFGASFLLLILKLIFGGLIVAWEKLTEGTED